MPATVRIGTSGDVAALGRLRFDMDHEQSADSVPLVEFAPAFELWFAQRCQDWITFIAEDDGQLVGTLWLGKVPRVPRPSNPLPADLGYVTFFYVRPSHRNLGTGAALLAAMNTFADAAPFETLVVWPSERSPSVYRRAGFNIPEELLERVILEDT